MAVAQGINKKIKRVKQSGLGSPGSAGSQYARRVTATFNKNSDTYENNEIVDHQQSTGATEGVYATSGQLNGLLSPGTYTQEFSCLLRKDFAATTAITGMSITIAGTGPTYTVTRAAGDFLAGGIKVGDVVRLTAGSFNAANLNKNLWVTAVTALQLTVVPLNDVALVAEGPIATATVSVPGKKAWVPTSGHTNDYYTWEVWYPDVSVSELYTDVKATSAAVGLPASGNSTVNFELPGLGRTDGTAEVLTAPTAATTTPVLTAVQGKVIVNGAVTLVTGLTINITGNVTQADAEVGSKSRSDHQIGRVAVSGSITAKFRNSTLQAIRNAQTPVTIAGISASDATANADFVSFVIPAAKLFTDEADDGEKEIIRTYNFTAQIPTTGGAALANHMTIISMQDSQAT